jgi:hypothetical protein
MGISRRQCSHFDGLGGRGAAPLTHQDSHRLARRVAVALAIAAPTHLRRRQARSRLRPHGAASPATPGLARPVSPAILGLSCRSSYRRFTGVAGIIAPRRPTIARVQQNAISMLQPRGRPPPTLFKPAGVAPTSPHPCSRMPDPRASSLNHACVCRTPSRAHYGLSHSLLVIPHLAKPSIATNEVHAVLVFILQSISHLSSSFLILTCTDEKERDREQIPSFTTFVQTKKKKT